MKSAPTPSAEFVSLVALLTALVALSIDTMLPALGAIAADLGADGANSRQYVLLAFFAGLGVGQLLFGPLSDRVGRKPAILLGLAVYAAGSLLCLLADGFASFLLGRVIQGFGASGPRIASVAMVRDGQAGAAMARVMSLVMTVFILVPIFAPAIGELVLLVASWRAIFAGFLTIGVLAGVWLVARQPETLPPAQRASAGLGALRAAAVHVLTHRATIGYTMAAGLMFGAMVAYLGMSQQVFVEQYGQGRLFVLWFALLAVAIGTASLVNARLVMRWGMRRLTRLGLQGMAALSALLLALCLALDGQPPFALFMACMLPAFFCLGITFGNLNALAMEPMGRVAGMAASVIGSATTVISLAVGMAIGQAYEGTLTPLAVGFVATASAAFAAIELLTAGGRT